jgi:D-proline reductase (dithiol) PrdD
VENERIMRQLAIRSYHVSDVTFGSDTILTSSDLNSYRLIISSNNLLNYIAEEELVSNIGLRIITPDHHDVWCNSIMDVIPISVKVLGKLGEGITNTLTGVYVILTGIDEEGTQICSFGSCEGILNERMKFGTAGTPKESDIIIAVDVTLKAKAGISRPGPAAAHRVCDKFCNDIREMLKVKKETECTEKHVYYDTIRPGKKKVAIVKLVAGQGSMYDTQLFGKEPSSFIGGRSIIDLGNMPVLLSPNEYRDGAIRALY